MPTGPPRGTDHPTLETASAAPSSNRVCFVGQEAVRPNLESATMAGQAAGDDRTKRLFFKYRTKSCWRTQSDVADGELAAATLRQNQQLTAPLGNLAKDWRIFRASGRAQTHLGQRILGSRRDADCSVKISRLLLRLQLQRIDETSRFSRSPNARVPAANSRSDTERAAGRPQGSARGVSRSSHRRSCNALSSGMRPATTCSTSRMACSTRIARAPRKAQPEDFRLTTTGPTRQLP